VPKHRETLLTQPAPESRLLTICATASYLSSTVWFVRRLAWERRVPFLHFGNRVLFDKADLDKYIESQKAVAK